MGHEESELSNCEFCGSPVIKKKTLDGARYYIPIAEDSLWDVLGKRNDLDVFLFDRLRRAEHIITDLRKKLTEKK